MSNAAKTVKPSSAVVTPNKSKAEGKTLVFDPNQSRTALMAEIEKLKAENFALKSKPAGTSMKVSEKGAVSVYGLGRFPVTLYREQWEKLLGMGPNILAFIEAHKAELKTKAEKLAETQSATPAAASGADVEAF